MDIIPHDTISTQDIVRFISLCYCKINRAIELDGKDRDLLNIEEEYCRSGGNLFVLSENGYIIGTIAIKFFSVPKGYIGEVHRLYVHPGQQGKGYGSKLLEYIYHYAKEKGANYLRGTTEYHLKSAVSLLKKRGAYEIPKYRKSNAEAFFEWVIPGNTPRRDFSEFSNNLKMSLLQLEEQNKKTLILNPVENYPDSDILFPCSSPLHGLYNTDSLRSDDEKIRSKIQFSGRNTVTNDVNSIYEQWAKLLGAKALTMRLLSGLHAHIVMFMAITSINDKVILLPEVAGGHMATKAILTRLGLQIRELPIDIAHKKVDMTKSLKLIEEFNPKVIFVDRSEGLVYEDFSWMYEINGPIKIFDGSQYLTNIITADYASPFEFGFDFILSTTHKNLPGPQRAFICCKEENDVWRQLKAGVSTFVSNMHFHSIYSAGLILNDYSKLQAFSRQMLKNTLLLDEALTKAGMPCIPRDMTVKFPNTHHIWISAPSRETAFKWYSNLEKVGILVNYRKLPYEIGYGLRLGLSAATYRGMKEKHIEPLADIIARSSKNPTSMICAELQCLLKQIDGDKNEK